jgi:hypothetical protein
MLAGARTGPGRGSLTGVISRCYFNSYRSNIEIVADVVTIRRQPFSLHQRSYALSDMHE